ncbi:HAD-IIIC family phosphatase [Brevibacillus humidisoli]|uniref:HAD-IIIC family phosphatase n=1 Tax=Brevibacillus humidisoli TaxID=2895522 RepID=UPI001E3B221B|nr:HAD-IIIC family phosphatase [Brevibacillus humidisoli]UFJ40041.1 HAD-IIIC family phosphatase [Brevibacillus humidisoli]
MLHYKMLLLGDTVIDPIVRFLADPGVEPVIQATVGPYNQIYQTLMDPSHAVWQNDSDILLIWSTPQSVIPSFEKLQRYENVSTDEILREVERFAELVRKASAKHKATFVISWSLPPHLRWNQAMTYQHNIGLTNILMQMNLLLAQYFSKHKNIVMLDSQYWYAALQKKSYDPKMYAIGKIHYTRDFFALAAEEIKAVVKGVFGQGKKLIICDLDNTLWGGIIGDDGIDHIKLGGIDPVGESFVMFQKELKSLKNRGILLAICSKNNQDIAMEVIEHHPGMVLRRDDFAAYQINWNDKAENIAKIASDLNIGLQSVVFLDDNPVERDRVKHAFPEIYTPDLPEDFTHYPNFLSALRCFDTLEITQEDRVRTELYRSEIKRKVALQEVASKEEWLKTLDIVVTVRLLEKSDLPRAVQLLNKTNQFNMATNRYTEPEYWEWSQVSNNRVYVFYVRDKFGDVGLTGVLSVALKEETAEIIDFVMSCRVMGKQIEDAMLWTVLSNIQAEKPATVRAIYRKTAKNSPFYEYIKSKYKDETTGVLEIAAVNKPDHITIL